MKKITFLHISDLHYGSPEQKMLFFDIQNKLFESIRKRLDTSKSLDVVFFTGDLVFKGSKDEYSKVTVFLHALWAIFAEFELNPYLICVPGNHDLERPLDSYDPTIIMLEGWRNNEKNVRDSFWKSKAYQSFINKCFINYVDWYRNINIKKPENLNLDNSILAGDFLCNLNIKEIKIGIIGFNSSFLQLSNGDYEKRLSIDIKQLNPFLNGKTFSEWKSDNDINIILSHHSEEWLTEDSLAHFYSDIYSDDLITEHLCGHMHVPSTLTTRKGSGLTRHLSIAPSLFGLEKYGTKNEDRKMGYIYGEYILFHSSITKNYWPRISEKMADGTFQIIPDKSFHIEAETGMATEILKGENISAKEDVNLVKTSKSNIEKLPFYIYDINESDKIVRKPLQEQAVKIIKEVRSIWIKSKIGLGTDGFIGSIIEESEITPTSCLRIVCEDVYLEDEIIAEIERITQTKFSLFIEAIKELSKPLLVFDRINPALYNNPESFISFIMFLENLKQYCETLKIICIVHEHIKNGIQMMIELNPLTPFEIKDYIKASDFKNQINNVTDIDRIHSLTDGYVWYIDRILRNLQIISIDQALDEESKLLEQVDNTDDNLPTPMKAYIKGIKASNDSTENRIYHLLCLLSLLPSGEDFDGIMRIKTGIRFRLSDLQKLMSEHLVENTPVQLILDPTGSQASMFKINKVPKDIREYVLQQMDTSYRIDSTKEILTKYLGNEWRSSNIKILGLSTGNIKYYLFVYNNIISALISLINSEINNDNKTNLQRYVKSTMSFAKILESNSALREQLLIQKELLLKLNELEGVEKDLIELKISLGNSYRMNGLSEKCITLLEDLYENEPNLTAQQKTNIANNLLHAYNSNENTEMIKKYADILIKSAKKNKRQKLFVEYSLCKLDADKKNRLIDLKKLLDDARKLKYYTLYINILISIYNIDKKYITKKNFEDAESKIAKCDYTYYRFLVYKLEYIYSENKNLVPKEIQQLETAYWYAYLQRLSTFVNTLHDIGWNIYINNKKYINALYLFQRSSFIWRLYGKIDKEKKYIKMLSSNDDFNNWIATNRKDDNSVIYYFNRKKELEV